MTTSEANAPPKTVIRGCLVAMIAAIKKVLSPVADQPAGRMPLFTELTDLRHDDHEERLGENLCS